MRKNISLILSFLLIFLSVYPSFVFSQYQTVDPKSLAQLSYEDAIKMREKGQLLEAERLIYESLDEFPESRDYQFELSNIYAAYHDGLIKTKKKLEAEQMLWKVVRVLETTVMLDPSFIPAQYNLAVVYKRLAEYERARERMRKVIQQAKEQGQASVEFNALLQMGAIYQEQGFFL
jgi:tetratricopeptide (TPR) repeat protein